MTRSILGGLAAAATLVAVMGTGCQATESGTRARRSKSTSAQFAGFSSQEVSTEGESFQCQTRLCLVNHFQGRVSCPYGQSPDGNPISSTPLVDSSGSSVTVKGCVTPGHPPTRDRPAQ